MEFEMRNTSRFANDQIGCRFRMQKLAPVIYNIQDGAIVPLTLRHLSINSRELRLFQFFGIRGTEFLPRFFYDRIIIGIPIRFERAKL